MTITSETRTYPGFPGKVGRAREESESRTRRPLDREKRAFGGYRVARSK